MEELVFDGQGKRAASLHENSETLESPPRFSVESHRHPTGTAMVGPRSLLSLQRSSGNASVAKLLAGSSIVVARKAAVDLPGWGDTLIGDDDTSVTFTPEGAFQTEAFSAALENAMGNYPQIVKLIQQGDLAVTTMDGRGGYSGILPIRAGAKGTVTITVKAHWFFDQKVNDEYDQSFSCSWNVEADMTGKLKFGPAQPNMVPIGDPEAPFQLTGLNPTQVENIVQISPQWQSFQHTDVPNTQVGIEVSGGEGGSITGGGAITLGNERTFPAGQMQKTFDLKLRAVDIPPQNPEVTIGPIEMRKHAVHEVFFEKPKQHRVSGPQENTLYLWYMSLSPDTRVLVRTGQEKVKLDGFASTTDKASNNRELSRKRVTSVMEILRDCGAKEFDDAAFGEYEEKVGEPGGEVETQDRRKVVVEIVEAPITIYEGDTKSPTSP